MVDFLIEWIIEFIAISFIIFLGYYFSKPSAKKMLGEEKVVYYSWFMKLLGFAGLLFGIGFYAYEVKFGGVTATDIPLIFITIIFLLLGSIIFLETFKSKVFFSDSGIRKESAWTRDHMIKWEHIEGLSYSETLSMVTIGAVDGSKIRVIEYMNGFEELMGKIEEKSFDKEQENFSL